MFFRKQIVPITIDFNGNYESELHRRELEAAGVEFVNRYSPHGRTKRRNIRTLRRNMKGLRVKRRYPRVERAIAALEFD